MESDTGKFHLYVDMLSQPCRSVVQLINFGKLKVELHHISIMKGDLNSKEYLEMCPMGTVPSLIVEESDKSTLYLYESCAILKFLCNRFNLSESFYPRSNLTRRALIDQYCDWHHTNTRAVFAGIFKLHFLKPFFEKSGTQTTFNLECPDEMPKLATYLGFYEKHYSKTKYFIDDELSIVDLLIYNEVNENYFLIEEFKKYPNFYRVLTELNKMPEIKETIAGIKGLMVSSGTTNAFAEE